MDNFILIPRKLIDFIQNQSQHPPYKISSCEPLSCISKRFFVPCLDPKKLYWCNYPHTFIQLVLPFIFIRQFGYFPHCFSNSHMYYQSITNYGLGFFFVLVSFCFWVLLVFYVSLPFSTLGRTAKLISLIYESSHITSLSPQGLLPNPGFLSQAFKNLILVTFCSYCCWYPVLT